MPVLLPHRRLSDIWNIQVSVMQHGIRTASLIGSAAFLSSSMKTETRYKKDSQSNLIHFARHFAASTRVSDFPSELGRDIVLSMLSISVNV